MANNIPTFLDPLQTGTFQKFTPGAKRLQNKTFGGSAGPTGPSANDISAQVTKDQWYSYLNQIGAPQEQQLMKFATDPTVVSSAMSEASADSTASFDRAAVNNDQMLRSLGLTLNADEKKASERSFALARSLGDVQSQEMARRGTVSLQQSVLGSPAPRIGG